MIFDGVQIKVSEYFKSLPKHFTEDSLLSAIERTGSEDMGTMWSARDLVHP
jgi:DNA topoisomerase-3